MSIGTYLNTFLNASVIYLIQKISQTIWVKYTSKYQNIEIIYVFLLVARLKDACF